MRSNDDILDMLSYKIYGIKRPYNNREYGSYLSGSEKDLLEKYVPILFNTYNHDDSLSNVIIELLELYIQFRTNKPNPKEGVISANQLEAMFYDDSPIPNKNKTRNEQVEGFKTHIEGLLKYLGGDNFGTEKGNKLKKILRESFNTPNEYIPQRRDTRVSKKEIELFLYSLKLENKSLQIQEFITEIK
jgi:hypothetical protein